MITIKSILLTFCLVFTISSSFATQNILVLGDSLSSGYGNENQASWVILLQQRLQQISNDFKVINASIPGDTTAGGLNRLPELLQKHQPKIVIIELGANDGLRGLSTKIIQQNLSQLITLSQQAHAKVVLVGVRMPPNYGEDYTKNFYAVYKILSKTHDVTFIPFMLENVAGNANLNQTDGIHPNEKAQAIILDNVWKSLQALINSSQLKTK